MIIGILQRATNAKTQTGIGQEKEIVALAYNSALAKKVSSGNSEIVTADDLNTELANQGASANGNDPIVVTFTSGNNYIIYNNGNIRKVEENNTIKLSFEELETGSRTVILKINLDDVEVPTVEEWLKTFSTDELKVMYANVMTNGYATWEQCMSGFSDIKDVWENRYGGINGPYANEYEMMIKDKKVDMSQYNAQYVKTTLTLGEESIKVSKSGEFTVTSNGIYTIVANNEDGELGILSINVTKSNLETYSNIQDSNTTLSIEGYEVLVPAGFAYGTSTNVGKVSTGFVITDSVDENNNSNGNEFIWIPIDKTNLTVANTSIKMATTSDETNYKGVLFDWNSYPNGNKILDSSSKEYEPYYLSSSYADGGQNNTINITQDSLQKNYNDMIASIKKYGGFYIARYEMGKSEYSKIGAFPTSSSDDKTNMWYGLYSRAKSYTNSKNSVDSSMIWGSQYDAMLQFARLGADKGKVSSSGNGNYTDKIKKTGATSTDLIINIYDLESNMWEWTLAGYNDKYRVLRGGTIDDKRPPSSRYIMLSPQYKSENIGTRISLTIK